MLVVGGVDEERRAPAGPRGGRRRSACRATAGVHPHEARLADEAVYDELRGLARDGRIVAIGEIGLDFHYDHSPRDAQREAFRRQVRLAREVGLPIVVHTREADDETARHPRGGGRGRGRGSRSTASPAASSSPGGRSTLGFFISFSGIVAFPRAEVIQQVAREVPEDRLLIETDAPFLAPPPHRGKRNEPAFVVEVATQGGGPAGHDRRGRRKPRPPQLRPPLPARRLTASAV